MLNSESAGESQGIGINIINSTLAVNGAEIKVFKVINIMKDSPAMGKLKIGDMIAIAFGSKTVTVRVLEIKETTKKTESVGMYEVVSETDE